ncbi:hypothetical protein AADA15_16835 [Phycobacter sp. 'Weihai']
MKSVLPLKKRGFSSVGLTVAILATSLTSLPMPAKAETKASYDYDCQITARRTGGWTPREVRFSLNESDMTVVVSDSHSELEGDGPYHLKMKRKKDGTLRFKWRVERPTTESFYVYIGYSVTFDVDEKTGTFRAAVPSGGHRDGPGTLICK